MSSPLYTLSLFFNYKIKSPQKKRLWRHTTLRETVGGVLIKSNHTDGLSFLLMSAVSRPCYSFDG